MTVSAAGYERHLERMQQRRAGERAAAAEIGRIPPVADPDRRQRASDDFQYFCETYRSDAFTICWSKDHLKILKKVQDTVIDGGLFALAMPRGSGKTTIVISAAIWALLNAHRSWVCLIGSTSDKAESLLKSIKTVLRFNDLLADDYPEMIYPIRRLQGKAQRVNSQTHLGVHTNSIWATAEVVFPTIPNAAASGARISVSGITGDIRGQMATTVSGEVIRPDYVICDDPQTRESAKSRQQTTDRIATVNGDILGLAGPGVTISGIIPCTVIHKGDLADQLLDRSVSPMWQGIRTQLLYGWPKNIKYWDEYFDIRNTSYQNDGDGSEATEYYLANQAVMDEGCEAAWPERYLDTEVSGIQSAMNIYGRDPAAFWSEYQNEPLQISESSMLSAPEISSRTNSYLQNLVPSDADWITAFIDIQKEMLFYTVIAWQKDFTGHIIDYGAWPDQKTSNFTLDRARRTLSKLWPKESLEVHLQRALTALTEELCERTFLRDDGVEVTIGRIGIDANWGQSRDIVYNFARHAKYRAQIIPAHGKYVGPESEPINAKHTSKHRGKTIGLHWRIARAKDTPVRHLLYDTNFWKSFLHTRLATEPNTSGSLTLFKPNRNGHHDTFAAHLTAEYPVRVIGRQREVDIWRLRPERPDNHWYDCCVGCAVLASSLGSTTFDSRKQMIVEPGQEPKASAATADKSEEKKPKKKKRQKVSYF